MSQKNVTYIVGALVLVVLIATAVWYFGWFNKDRQLFKLIKNDPQLVELYNKAKAVEAKIAKTPAEASLYFDAGLDWKSIAELTSGDKTPFLKRTLQVYQDGIKRFGSKNILFYLNGGKLAERFAGYALAESYYREAIRISPQDESGYLYLVDLYINKLKKPAADILAVLNEAEKKVNNYLAVFAARAEYLYKIGDYANALADYKKLSENYPNFQGYKNMIKEIEQKLKK